MRQVKCDKCGYTDDWAIGETPFFPEGVVLGFRAGDCSQDIVIELELCVNCRDVLLTQMPDLNAAYQKRMEK